MYYLLNLVCFSARLQNVYKENHSIRAFFIFKFIGYIHYNQPRFYISCLQTPSLKSLTATIECSICIDIEPAKLWAIISKPGILEKTHPFCKKNEVIRWNREKSIDTIVYYNGRKMQRNFIDWNEGKGYQLLIGHNELADALVTWSIKESHNHSILSIGIVLYLDNSLGHIPKVLRKIIGHLYLYPIMKSYLNSVLSGFKFFSEKNKTVTKNQFGYNQLFSTKS